MSNLINPKEPITIIGAGLVGSLLSVFLSKKGYQVHVLERRPDMRIEKISAGRSINLAISTRGLHALGQVGLKDDVLKHAIPMKGRMIHGKSGELSFQRYGKDDSEYINSISRGTLNKILMSAAERTEKTKIQFNHKVSEINLNAHSVTLATDGAFSAARDQLKSLKLIQSTETHLEHGYKELTIPAGKGGSFQIEKNALHIWPRGTYMLIALPNLDGSFTCTLFLPLQGKLSFENLKNETHVTTLFKEQFADALNLMPSLAEDFFSNPTGTLTTVKSTPWHHQDKVLLLGDAAHAIVPFFGQGMNCGFEDCSVFNTLMDQCANWEELFKKFSTTRKPNADAIADMAVENFIEMRDKVADPKFLLEKQIEKKLKELFPDDYFSRYSLVSFSLVDYSKAYEVGLIQNKILAQLSNSTKNADDMDLILAKNLVEKNLLPYFNKQIKPLLFPSS